jgi:hypothetical protein
MTARSMLPDKPPSRVRQAGDAAASAPTTRSCASCPTGRRSSSPCARRAAAPTSSTGYAPNTSSEAKSEVGPFFPQDRYQTSAHLCLPLPDLMGNGYHSQYEPGPDADSWPPPSTSYR